MHSHTNTKQEADSAKIFFQPIFYLSFLLLLITSCTQNKNDLTPAKAITQNIFEKTKLNTASLAKPAKPKKKIYLTFDDGPNKGTMKVLQTVKEENIPVSFFIVGQHVFDSPTQTAAWQDMKKDTSIELCNHSYTHASGRYSKFYEDSTLVIKDFEKSANSLSFTNNVTRMPGRNAWRIDSINHTDIKASEKTIDAVNRAGFAVMGWDIEWTFDHKTFAPDENTELLLRKMQNMLDASTTKTPGHLVLLAHDQAFQNEEDIEKLQQFFRQLKNNPQYEFVLASNYPGVKIEKEITSSVNVLTADKK
ncbi:MAG: polysaccharide deacetylase family protein [Chitinophagaceae bacterium]|nr:polysaccharide deacetylase family protein [Chitinophagaceae bacterium]